MLIHKPWNPHCKVCQACKKTQCATQKEKISLRATWRHFGDIVTCDHLVSDGSRSMSAAGSSYGFMLYDIKTQYLGAFPCATKSGIDTLNSLR